MKNLIEDIKFTISTARNTHQKTIEEFKAKVVNGKSLSHTLHWNAYDAMKADHFLEKTEPLITVLESETKTGSEMIEIIERYIKLFQERTFRFTKTELTGSVSSSRMSHVDTVTEGDALCDIVKMMNGIKGDIEYYNEKAWN